MNWLGSELVFPHIPHPPTSLDRFRNAPRDTKSKLIYKFTDPREVEIMVRCCRHWTTAYK
jgi:hypothetical protein